MTVMTAVLPAGFACGGDTKATPGVDCRADATLAAVSGGAPAGSSTATTSGPLAPGPKPSASRS